MTRRYTLYAESATERNKWRSALNSAVEARKTQQDVSIPPYREFDITSHKRM